MLFIFAGWYFVVVLVVLAAAAAAVVVVVVVLLLLLSEMERTFPQIALLNPVDSNLTGSFHNHP